MADILATVNDATVLITGLDEHGARQPIGSGYFIAPGLALSCAHVVAPAREPQVRWHGHDFEVEVVRCEPRAAGADGRFAVPDAALLRIDAETPCVPLSPDGPKLDDEVWVSGFSKIRTGAVEPYAGRLTVVQPDLELGLFRIDGDWVTQGLSGAPVLNLSTYGVCGTFKAEMKSTGWVVSIDRSLAALEPGLLAGNMATYSDGLPALRRRQTTFEAHVAWITNCLGGQPAARAQLEHELRNRHCRPELVGKDAFAEWAARQLIELSISDLQHVFRSLKLLVRAELLVRIFELVACCHQGRDGSETWVAASASEALRAELDGREPRVFRVTASSNPSAEAVLSRAFVNDFEPLWVTDPISADPGDDVARQLATIYLSFAGYPDPLELGNWADPDVRERIRQSVVEGNQFALVGVASAASVPDDAWFRELAEHFRGFPLMVRGRGFLPSAAADMILDLQPPIDYRHELAVAAVRETIAGRKTKEDGRP